MPKIRKDNVRPRICQQCGKYFLYSHKYNKTCSPTCSGLFRRKGVYKTCVICEKLFYLSKNDCKENSKCCSIKCRGEWWSRKLLSNRKIPMNFYKSGVSFERKALIELGIVEGCQIVTRTPQSRGVFDVYGIKFFDEKIDLYLIQVKAIRGIKTVNCALPLEQRNVFIDRVKNNTYPAWRNSKLLKGKPLWANDVHFEVWLYEKNKGLHKFRMNVDSMDFEERYFGKPLNTNKKESYFSVGV